MKHKYITQILLITLALLAGVFFADIGCFAAEITPWNVVAVVTHNGRSVKYELQSNISREMNAESQHSLVSSYVLAGFDAMVSDGGADLTFTNCTEAPLYISAKVDNKCKSITFCIYGIPNLYTVERENEEIRTPFETVDVVDKEKFPELIYTDQTKVISGGSDGVKSKSYLCFYRDGKLVMRKLIRQNVYKKVDRIVARGYMERED